MKARLLLTLLGLGLLAGGGAGLYWFQFRPKSTITTAPEIGPALSRKQVPVPKVPFTNITESSGIRFVHENGLSGKKLLPETMGGGVAVIDFDQDGLPDLFFVNSCPWPGHQGRDVNATCKLYRNQGNGQFVDVTAAMGLNLPMFGMGVAVGDFNNDGFPDLFVSGVGQQRLFQNERGTKFRDVTASANLGTDTLPKCSWDEFLKWDKPIPFGSSATFVDYDCDGKLDLFVCHYVTWSPKIDLNISSTLRGGTRTFAQPREFDGAQCQLFRNVDGQRFEDVTASAGLLVRVNDGIGPKATARPVAKALGVVICDPDEDGWPDLVVANDTVRNFFYRNIPGPNGTRKFEEVGEKYYVAYADEGKPRGGMGIDWGEYQPGKSALVIANFANEASTFLRLNSPKQLTFSDAALSVGLAGPSRQLLKFGAFFFDFDLDGRLDLLTCNGHIDPDVSSIQASQTYAQPAQLFWNTGDPQQVFAEAKAADVGEALFQPLVGRGSAYLDLDLDGDLDVVLVANGGPAQVYRNDNQLGHNWIRLELQGNGRTANRSAIGAEVTIEAGGQVFRRRISGAKGYLSQSEATLTVGLGRISKVDQVTVRWPAVGSPTQTWTNLEVKKLHKLIQE